MSGIVLTDDEIYEITRYKLAAKQLRALKEMGIKATRRHDNTVCVLRVHLTTQPANDAPAKRIRPPNEAAQKA